MTHLDVELARFAVEVDPELRRVAVQYDEPIVADAVLTANDVEVLAVRAGNPAMGTAFTNLPPAILSRRLRVTVTIHPRKEQSE